MMTHWSYATRLHKNHEFFVSEKKRLKKFKFSNLGDSNPSVVAQTLLIIKMMILLRRCLSTTPSVTNKTLPLASLIPNPHADSVMSTQSTTVPSNLSIPALMAANCHLGASKLHRTMLPYVYGVRNGLNIINLEHTIVNLRKAANAARKIAFHNGIILFVGTRKSIHRLTVDSALKANAYYNIAWVGGTLTNKERVLRRSVGYDPDKVAQVAMNTNFQIEERIAELEESRNNNRFFSLEEEEPEPSDENLVVNDDPVVEAVMQPEESSKSLLTRRQPPVPTPDLMIVLDYSNNLYAIKEANLMNIPVIAICDTDMNPNLVQYPIPANDDSISSVELIAGVLSKACQEGNVMREQMSGVNRS